MTTVRNYRGLDYTLTLKTLCNTRGLNKSTIEVKDLTGKVFEVWHRRYRLWRHPIHGTVRSIAAIKEIYNAIDIDDYIKQDASDD